MGDRQRRKIGFSCGVPPSNKKTMKPSGFSQSALALPPPQSRDRDRHPAPGTARAGPSPPPVPGLAHTRARFRARCQCRAPPAPERARACVFSVFSHPHASHVPPSVFSISGPIPAESSVIRQLPPLLQGGARSRLLECLSIKTSYRWRSFPAP